MQNSRQWIVWCVGLGGMLVLGCAVFGSLWSGLSGLGDAQGAKVCRDVFWGLVVCWCLNGIGLIGLLTAHVLNLTAQPEEVPAKIVTE